jgi:hypothetical protein
MGGRRNVVWLLVGRVVAVLVVVVVVAVVVAVVAIVVTGFVVSVIAIVVIGGVVSVIAIVVTGVAVVAVVAIAVVAAAITTVVAAVAAFAVGLCLIERDVQAVIHCDRRHDGQQRREAEPSQQQGTPCAIAEESTGRTGSFGCQKQFLHR